MKKLLLFVSLAFMLASCGKSHYALVGPATTSQQSFKTDVALADSTFSEAAAAQMTEATDSPLELPAQELEASTNSTISTVPVPTYQQPSPVPSALSIKKQQTRSTAKFDKKNGTKAKDDRKTNVPALLSFIFGLLGLFIAGIPLGIAAVVLGIIGLVKINKEPERFKGRGFAIVGLILGLIDVILVLAFLSTM